MVDIPLGKVLAIDLQAEQVTVFVRSHKSSRYDNAGAKHPLSGFTAESVAWMRGHGDGEIEKQEQPLVYAADDPRKLRIQPPDLVYYYKGYVTYVDKATKKVQVSVCGTLKYWYDWSKFDNAGQRRLAAHRGGIVQVEEEWNVLTLDNDTLKIRVGRQWYPDDRGSNQHIRHIYLYRSDQEAKAKAAASKHVR